MKNELINFMTEVTNQILVLKGKTEELENRLNIIQEDLGEIAKVSNNTLNESMLKLTELMGEK